MKAIKEKNLYEIYRRSFLKTAKEAQLIEGDRTLFLKSIFNGIRMFNLMPDLQSIKDEEHKFNVSVGIKYAVGFLTPNEFMTIFPPEKDFDGYKFECKDYWSTMEEINKLDRNKAIKDQVDPLEFMFEYHNWDIHRFSVEVACCLSNLRQADGHLSMFEEFMVTQGMETQNTFKNSKGDTLHVRHGKPEVIKKSKTKHLILMR